MHFLGCGGLSKTKDFKQTFDGDEYSVDVSTPINRAIDGATSGKSFSGIYSYNDFEFYRINEHTKNEIINDYELNSPIIKATGCMNNYYGIICAYDKDDQ